MSPRPRDPKPRRNIGRGGRITWTVRYRLHGEATSRTFAHTSRDPSKPPRDALEFCADARDFDYPEADRRLEERKRADPGHHGPTLDDVFAEFIEWKRPRVKSGRTVEDYAAQYRAISPVLGSRPVDSIGDADVQRWVDAMVSGTVGARMRGGELTALHPKTIANYHGLLHDVFGFAAASTRRYVTTNPCAGTELPKRRKGQPKGLRPAEAAALHAALRQVDPDAADLALVMHASGMRLGEATALSTFEVEDDGEVIILTVSHVLRRMAGGRFERVEDTKSDAGFRQVDIVDPDALEVLRRRVGRTRAGGLLFTNRHGRPWLPSTLYRSAWEPAVELANLTRKPTPHWLRHTHIGELIREGVPLPEIQARVGHENISTTVDTYGRWVTGVNREALKRAALRRSGGATQIETATIQSEVV